MHNFTRECQVIGVRISCHTFVMLLPYRVKVRYKSNTFHTIISTLHMLISITFRRTSIDETTKNTAESQRLKIYVQMSTIHANTCIQTTTPLCNHCPDDGMVQQPPLAQQTFFQLLYIMDPRTVDPLLKDIPWRCCSPPDSNLENFVPHLWRDKIWRLSRQHGDWWRSRARWTAWFQWRQHYVTRSLPSDVHGTERSKFISMISIHLQSCVPKIIKIRAYL